MGTVFSQDGSLQLQRSRAEYIVENIGLGGIYSGLDIRSLDHFENIPLKFYGTKQGQP